MDYNLFGMNFIYLDLVKFRRVSVRLNDEQAEICIEILKYFLLNYFQKLYHFKASLKSEDLKKLELSNEPKTKWNILTLDE